MRIINKVFCLCFFFSISCKPYLNEEIIEQTIDKPTIETLPPTQLTAICKDCQSYRILDTLENGRKVKIIYDGTRTSKKFETEVWNYQDGKLVNTIKDTIVEDIKLYSKQEINEDERTITIFEKNNPKREYLSIFKFEKGKLVYKIIVNSDKDGKYIETKIGFDTEGQIITKLKRDHQAFQFPKNNQNNEITEYYKFGKKYQWSKLISTDSKTTNDSKIIRLETINYYTLKNELIKKDYLRDISYLTREFDGLNTRVIQKIELLKTEFFKNGNIIKIEDYQIP